jgi:hypothetical protein
MLLFAASSDAATITVPTTADTSGTQCTLRDAIHAADFDDPEGACAAGSGADVISIDAVGTIMLGSALPQIESGVSVTGPGNAALVAVQANGTSFRVFDIDTPEDVALSNLTITGGFASGDGGGVNHAGGGTLTLDNVQLTSNEASVTTSGSFASAEGGGVFSGFGSPLEIRNSLVSNNTVSATGTGAGGATVANGSAIVSRGGLVIDGTTVAGNSTDVSSQENSGGSGAVVAVGAAEITNSAILANNSTGNTSGGTGNTLLDGGGIEQRGSTASERLTLENVTIAGNTLTATGVAPGGGFERGGGIATGGLAGGSIESSTIAQNRADQAGANILLNASGETLTFENTIVAYPSGPDNCAVLNGTLSSLGHNLEDDATPAGECGFTTAATDISNTDPLLDPVAQNAGPTGTMAPQTSPSMSPVIDKGISTGETTDQRGDARPRDLNSVANAIGGDGSDIGAYELQSTEPDRATVDFGRVLRGSASPTQTITVTNTTGSSLLASAATLAGPDTADFTLAADICGVTLTSLASCTFDVSFAPPAATNVGAKSAFAHVGDDASVQPLLVSLSGTATVPAPPPPPPPTATPPSATPPAAKKKCKKARKLKKGKCVKRKKKK